MIVSSKDGIFDSYLDFANGGSLIVTGEPLKITSRASRIVNSGQLISPQIQINSNTDIGNSGLIQADLLNIKSNHGSLLNLSPV